MACDVNTSTPVLTLLQSAYVLAGNDNQPIPGKASEAALRFLNQTLARLSGQSYGITFLTELNFEGTNSGEYHIGLTRPADTDPLIFIESEPFTYMATGKSTLGRTGQPLEFVSQAAFNNIIYKYSGGWPRYATYFLAKDHTVLRIFPQPQPGYRITIQGLKRLEQQSYFTSLQKIPGQNETYLEYEVANLLIDHRFGQPQASFYENYSQFKDDFIRANQQDYTVHNGNIAPFMRSLVGGGVLSGGLISTSFGRS